MAKSRAKTDVAQQGFVPGTSRRREEPHTVLLRMAMEAQRQAEIGLRLKELRGPRPQRVIAEAVPVTLRAYQAWEAGDSGPSWPHLERLAVIHGVSTGYLLHGDEDQPLHGTQLDRIEKKVDALLSGLNEARAMQQQTHGILAEHDRLFRERILQVGAQVDELQEHVDGRLEELRLEGVADVAEAFEDAPRRQGAADPSRGRTPRVPGEAQPRRPREEGSRE